MTSLTASQQATRTSRNRVLWEEEARTIRTNAPSLAPAARQRIRAVLETILCESDEGDITASARSLLVALERLERELGEGARRPTALSAASTASGAPQQLRLEVVLA